MSLIGKIGFLYPGQGSQTVGMGADLRHSGPALFDGYMAQADAASGLPITRYCLEGPLESLTKTEVAQPALFALSLALTDYARQIGLRPDFLAGHSLGEYTAAVACGTLVFEDGMQLVCHRGRFMADVQAENPGAMAAIIGLSTEQLDGLCQAASDAGLVTLANLNTPAQTVVSGTEAAVDKLLELARQAGARQAVRLQTGAAFHSPFMRPVQVRLAEIMDSLTWRQPQVPLAANVSGELVTDGQRIRDALVDQVASPVRWAACVETLIRAGCTTLLEIGPGRVLSGLVRQINREVDVSAVDSPGKIEAFATAHRTFVRH